MDFIPWAWGINGCASVVSPVMASIVSVEFGFRIVILMAVLFYGFAAFGAYLIKNK